MDNLVDAPRLIADKAGDRSTVSGRGVVAFHQALLLAIVGFTSWRGYVGFIASDDGSYSEAALGARLFLSDRRRLLAVTAIDTSYLAHDWRSAL